MLSLDTAGLWRRRIVLLGVLLAIPCPALAQAQAERPVLNVLLVGNSQLWGNNIGDVLAGIAAADPVGPIIVPTMTLHGTLQGHWEGEGRRLLEGDREWDYVILQEVALLPGNVEPPYVAIWPQPEREFEIGSTEEFHDHVRKFAEVAEGKGAKVILFPSPPRQLARFDADQLPVWKEIMDAHIEIAREVGADVAPIQEAFEETRQRLIGLNTYMYDGSHTSPAGAYLEGLVLYAIITDRDPTGAPTVVYGRPIRYLPSPNPLASRSISDIIASRSVNSDLRVPLVELLPATALELQRIAWHVTSQRVRTATH